MHARSSIIALLSAAALLIAPAYANPITLTVGTPLRSGPDGFEVTFTDGTTRIIGVEAMRGDQDGKALRLLAEIRNVIDPSATRNGAEIKINSTRVASFKILKDGNKSGESFKAASLSAGLFATVGFSGSLSGVDDDGQPSVFHAALGFDGLNIEADLTFGELSNPSVGGLLTDIYDAFLAELPIDLRPNLSLDLAGALVSFQFPSSQTGYFVETFASDRSLSAELELAISAIPEPASLTLLLFGILSLTIAGKPDWYRSL
jgi:hypothetical protein